MTDTRLNSVHPGSPPGRQPFRGRGEGLPALSGDRADQPPFGPRSWLIDQRTGCRYRLVIGLNTIGRLRNNDIVLKGYRISHRHCVLLVDPGGDCELHDTASRSGTFVNGRRVRRPVPLASGDWIQVPQKVLLFLSEQDGPTAPLDGGPLDRLTGAPGEG